MQNLYLTSYYYIIPWPNDYRVCWYDDTPIFISADNPVLPTFLGVQCTLYKYTNPCRYCNIGNIGIEIVHQLYVWPWPWDTWWKHFTFLLQMSVHCLYQSADFRTILIIKPHIINLRVVFCACGIKSKCLFNDNIYTEWFNLTVWSDKRSKVWMSCV